MNGGFALLWSKILDSSIWMESKETRLVWITLLAMKDKDGVIHAASTALAHRARVELLECEQALAIFLAPDPHSTSANDQGRRIRVVSGGWQIINHEQYRFSTEAKREFWRETKRKERADAAVNAPKRVKRSKSKTPAQVRSENDAREHRYLAALDRGDQESADAICAEGLPGNGVNGDSANSAT